MKAGWPRGSAMAHGLLFLLVAILSGLGPIDRADAGCSFSALTHGQMIEGKPVAAGQLALAIYVRYERGSLSFTLERPVRSCEGPECRTKSSMEPTYLIPVGHRLTVSNAAAGETRWQSGTPVRASFSRPFSLYAPRGSLEACEPPPKSFC